MCLIHADSAWSAPKEAAIHTTEKEYPLVFDITKKRITQEKTCAKCKRVKVRVVDTVVVDKRIRGSFGYGD